MKTPESSHVPDLTLVFSWMEQSSSSFLLQMLMACFDSRATVDMSADQTTYLYKTFSYKDQI